MVQLERARQRMLDRHLAQRGIDGDVLAAMGEVPRERFVDEAARTHAYDDAALPIACGQSISQPYVVALMLRALDLRPTDRLLEVGSGSGYATAVASRLVSEVFAIELHPELVERARACLAETGSENVELRVGDGSLGWAQRAPFDAILVSAGGPHVPEALLDELAIGGRLVMPVGDVGGDQELVRFEKVATGKFESRTIGSVRFVPLICREW